MNGSRRSRAFVARNRLPISLALAALAIALWFGTRLVLDVVRFHDPRHDDTELEGWMTPRYIVLTYDLPRPYVAEILKLTERDRGRRLKRIAEDQGLTLDELTARVRAAAEEYRADPG